MQSILNIPLVQVESRVKLLVLLFNYKKLIFSPSVFMIGKSLIFIMHLQMS